MERTQEELTRLSDLIGLIYEGATDPARWTKDILPAVAEYIQAPACLLFTSLHSPQNGGFFFFHGVPQDRIDLYVNKYITEDVWTHAALKHNLFVEGGVIIGEELVSREQLIESKIYNEYMSRDENMGGNYLPVACLGLIQPIQCQRCVLFYVVLIIQPLTKKIELVFD